MASKSAFCSLAHSWWVVLDCRPVADGAVDGLRVLEYLFIGAVGAKGFLCVGPPAVPVFRGIAGVIHGAAANAADAGGPLGKNKPEPSLGRTGHIVWFLVFTPGSQNSRSAFDKESPGCTV